MMSDVTGGLSGDENFVDMIFWGGGDEVWGWWRVVDTKNRDCFYFLAYQHPIKKVMRINCGVHDLSSGEENTCREMYS